MLIALGKNVRQQNTEHTALEKTVNTIKSYEITSHSWHMKVLRFLNIPFSVAAAAILSKQAAS